MCPVRVGKVACGKHLLRFYLLQQLHRQQDILLAYGVLLGLARFVKRQRLEMDIAVRQPREAGPEMASVLRMKPFYVPDLRRIYLVGQLVLDETCASRRICFFSSDVSSPTLCLKSIANST
jgi:hypothetical protein